MKHILKNWEASVIVFFIIVGFFATLVALDKVINLIW